MNDVLEIAPGVWRLGISPSDAHMFGAAPSALGERTVLLLIDAPIYSAAERQLAFDPRTVRVLNIGTSEEALIMTASAQTHVLAPGAASNPIPSTGGDADFLTSLPGGLADIGTKLLSGVRSQVRGELKYFEDSRRYVEAPDNFWTVKIQPRDGSLRVTVRGRPSQLPSPADLTITDDRPGYSTFKVSTVNQVASAVELIRTAGRRGH